MQRHRLHAQPLTAAGFAAYGTVLAVSAAVDSPPSRFINGGTTERFDLVDDLQLAAQGGRAQLAIFRAQARPFPHVVTEMEQHTLGSQSFVPLGAARRFVIVVSAAGALPTAESLAAFITDGQQGVTLTPGTWHHALLAVDAGDFVVIERVGEGMDCEVHRLAAPVEVDFKSA